MAMHNGHDFTINESVIISIYHSSGASHHYTKLTFSLKFVYDLSVL